MAQMIEASQLPYNERVYLKKDFLGWRTVLPIRNPDGSMNWFNLLLGGKRGVAWLLFILLLSGLFYLGVKELIGNYKLVNDNPCQFCKDCQLYVTQTINALHYGNVNNQTLNKIDFNSSWVSPPS